ncbi:MAG: zf-HC2 domain-containing protein [Acidobacteria bacterium]|jgi:predicted anti-sigma-YlaC factor YlaD|nr:zf-HC2 domain-containing protein [Acidobacteriota bacterium]
MDCERFEELIDAYLTENIDEELRRRWRAHLAACQQCRSSALEREPMLLLASAPQREASPFEVAACARGVRALIHQRRLTHRLHRRAYRWLAAAAVVVVLLSGGMMLRSLHVAGTPPRTAATDQAQEPSPAQAPEIDVEMDGRNVRVYQFAVDDPNMAVTLIVNPAMEL